MPCSESEPEIKIITYSNYFIVKNAIYHRKIPSLKDEEIKKKKIYLVRNLNTVISSIFSSL